MGQDRSVRTMREYPGLAADELAEMLDGFQPPQGYTLIDKPRTGPVVRAGVCDQLTQTPVVRHPARLP